MLVAKPPQGPEEAVLIHSVYRISLAEGGYLTLRDPDPERA